jgi:hypothetical protein
MSIYLETEVEDGLTIELKAFGPSDCRRVDQALATSILPPPAKTMRHEWSNGKTYSFFKEDCQLVQKWLQLQQRHSLVSRRSSRPTPTPAA